MQKNKALHFTVLRTSKIDPHNDYGRSSPTERDPVFDVLHLQDSLQNTVHRSLKEA